MSKSVHLSQVADKIPGDATATSRERRLMRLLNNPAVRVREWYEAIAIPMLKGMAESCGEIRLIIDSTKIGFGHQLLMVTVAFRRRAIPIAWTWIRCSRGHSSARKQLALLSYVRGLLPKGVRVLLVGDSEFGSVDALKTLKRWRWTYVLRQKGNHQIKLLGQRQWQRFDGLITKPGQSLWLGPGYLTYAHNFKVNLFAYWKIGENEPWLLATNLSTPHATLAAYRRRMWIEEMFGDLKAHGFDLERTHLRHFMRLSRLTLAAALLYVWLVAFGSHVIKTGLRCQVDRVDRRDLSIFRIGYRMIENRLANERAFSISFVLSG